MSNKEYPRSNCPISSALELFGDRWSLLIIRDIVFWGKKTYVEFLRSQEGIATNILADRLRSLELNGIISKTSHRTDKRKDIYNLTSKGLDLIPVLLDLVLWYTHYSPGLNESKAFLAALTRDQEKMAKTIKEQVAGGGFVFSRSDWAPRSSN